jgi:ATP-dependent DNA helicase RecQ
MKQVERYLHQYFNFTSLRTGQKEVIETIINGDSAAAIFPTGSGKSLCYQLPALIFPHLTLVVSPLLALMKDQIDFLTSRNIVAASIDSTQSREESSEVMQGVRNGRIKILMISVERLKNERFREFIKSIPISLLVVDEAHCISEWGHNFRPDYIKLPKYQQAFNIKQVLLLTATATPHVIADMSAQFGIKQEQIVVTGFYRSNLSLIVQSCVKPEKSAQLKSYLQLYPGESAIVYVTLQKTAEQVAKGLNQSGIRAEAYHAGLASDIRKAIQERFMQSQGLTIVATIAFGMGIDKSDIRHIIHYDLPKSIENYAQEIGRAGRDGNPSNCLLLGNFNGLNVLENFVYGDTPDVSGIETVLNEIKNSPDQWEVLLNPLSVQSNIRQLPLKTLLVYLEIKGIIKSLYSYYAEYKFKLLIPENELIERFSGERQSFVKAIMFSSKKAKIWYTLDFDRLLQHYSADRQRVIVAMEYFQQKGWIILESKQMTEVYQLINDQFEPAILAQQLYQQFKQKEHSQIQRIKEMLDLFQSQNCLSRQLAEYFGDTQLQQACGHCSVCTGKYQPWPAPIYQEEIQLHELGSMAEQLNEAITVTFGQPASADLVCRYLCGISTPWLTKIRARKLGNFARYEQFAYARVRSLLTDII